VAQAYQQGYRDEASLTRAMRQLIGQKVAQSPTSGPQILWQDQRI